MNFDSSRPVDWVGKPSLGFVINAEISAVNTGKVTSWLAGLNELAPDGVYTMTPESLHITVLDWVAPLLDYGGLDKRQLYRELRTTYEPAFHRITETMEPFDVHFDEVRVTPGTIILVGQDEGQFQSLRERFLQSVSLPEGGKQPPSIIHSSLARFIPPAIDLAPVQEYVSSHPLEFSQRIGAFRLLETRREPTQDFTVLDSYSLGSGKQV